MNNFDSLHNLLANLNYDFDVIAVSETWNPAHKTNNFRSGILNGYHPYLGQTSYSIKGGCGIYLKKNT